MQSLSFRQQKITSGVFVQTFLKFKITAADKCTVLWCGLISCYPLFLLEKICKYEEKLAKLIAETVFKDC